MMRIKRYVKFEEFPSYLQHTIETIVEWHDVLVYEIDKDMYGFMIIEPNLHNDMPIKSKQCFNSDTLPKQVQSIIDAKFSETKCLYFNKGCFGVPPYLGLEILTLCRIYQGYGFSIEMHSTDYGFVDGKNSRIAPAHVHVLDETGKRLGMLNITGPCPKKISDIKEFRPISDKETPLTKHRKNIVKWANSKIELNGVNGPYEEEYWYWIKILWSGGKHW
jgi:hypothetical protein